MLDSKYISPFQYLGGKYSVLDWLLPLLPHTKSFVDVFGGGAHVILNKRPSQINTYNDIDGNVTNFFKVLRDYPDALIPVLELTMHSRQEYNDAWIEDGLDDLERARRFFVRTRQSFMSTGNHCKTKGWSATTNSCRAKMSEATSKWLNSVNGLQDIVEKLRSIQIENKDYRWIFKTYGIAEALLYCDPPYDSTFRSGNSDYAHDFTIDDHIALNELAKSANCLVAVSGYNSEMMMDLYAGFNFHKGPSRRNNFSKKQGIYECLWTNYDPKSLKGQIELFNQ